MLHCYNILRLWLLLYSCSCIYHRSVLVHVAAASSSSSSAVPSATTTPSHGLAHDAEDALGSSSSSNTYESSSQETFKNKGLESYDLKVHCNFRGFYRKWHRTFPPTSAIHNYDASNDPLKAMQIIHDSFAFCNKFLPAELVSQLLAFPYDPEGPSFLVLRNLPIDKQIPPTPFKTTVFDTEGQSAKLPIAETWLLGISRLLGQLTSPPSMGGAGRTSLIRSITQNPSDKGTILPMHRDYPRQCLSKFMALEPEIFILMGVRSDAANTCTVVMDNRKLLQLLPRKDVKLLQEHIIAMTFQMPGSGNEEQKENTYVPMGSPFYSIDPSDETMITLFDLPNSKATSPDGGDAVVQAYDRLQKIAFEKGERIALGPGDMLIINNGRLVHGRTAFDPHLEVGADSRWLIKSYVINALLKPTGTDGSVGLVDYPKFYPQVQVGEKE